MPCESFEIKSNCFLKEAKKEANENIDSCAVALARCVLLGVISVHGINESYDFSHRVFSVSE
jgi:hypothetical protein